MSPGGCGVRLSYPWQHIRLVRQNIMSSVCWQHIKLTECRALPSPDPSSPLMSCVFQVDPLMASRMATWVVWGVINWQRKMDQYAEAQRR